MNEYVVDRARVKGTGNKPMPQIVVSPSALRQFYLSRTEYRVRNSHSCGQSLV